MSSSMPYLNSRKLSKTRPKRITNSNVMLKNALSNLNFKLVVLLLVK